VITLDKIHEGIAQSLKTIDDLVDEIAKAGDDAAQLFEEARQEMGLL